MEAGFGQLPAADPAQLVLNDAWGHGGIRAANQRPPISNLWDSIHGEETGAVWQEIISVLAFIDDLEQRPAVGRPSFRAYARQLLGPQLVQAGLGCQTGEPPTDTLLRGQLITGLGNILGTKPSR